MKFERFLILVCFYLIFTSCSKKLVIVENGITNYKIVLSSNAKEIDEQAANELQKYLKEISGAVLPVVKTSTMKSDSVIILCSAGSADDFVKGKELELLEEDGFTIKTDRVNLIIAGGSEKGVLYGVYTFLEDYLGCRKYSSKVTYTPKSENIVIKAIDDRQVPRFKFRQIHYIDAYNPEYMAWHKLDDANKERYLSWRTRVHTFQHLVPAGEYFNDHPEYFSMINGRRVPDKQLCLTNQDVFRTVVSKLRKMMEKNPQIKYWDVSQNDTYGNCQCPQCSEIDEREGTPMGSLLTFVNRVAREFPDKIISTLAYQYSRSAPKSIKPEKNVLITLCSIECNRSKSIETDPLSASFRKDVEDWGKIAEHIFIWDYVVQFRNLVNPFPNLQVLQPNLQFFLKNGACDMFQQGNGGSRGEFSELRTYLIAKILWKPDINLDEVTDDFLHGYYGNAAQYLKKYSNEMHDSLEKSGEELLIYGNAWMPRNGYLSREKIAEYNELFDKAESSVAGEEKLLERVKIARLSLDYAMLEQAKWYGTGENGFFEKSNTGKWTVKQEMIDRLENFVSLCTKAEIKLIEEHGYSPDGYKADVERFLERNMPDHLALFKPVELRTNFNPKYEAGGAAALTNGLKGLEDFNCNWLGFEGEDLEAVIDLGEMMTVHKISTDFLQDNYSWVFLPLEVEYLISTDGINFKTVANIRNKTPDTKPGKFFEAFEAEFEGTQAQFIRVKATNMKTCPDWHTGKGGKSWIFADEVIIR